MTDSTDTLLATRKLGFALLVWAAPGAVAGVFITFSVNHAPHIGMIGLAILSLGTAVARGWSIWAIVNLGATWRWANGVVVGVSVLAGIVSLVSLTQTMSLGLLVMTLATWAALVAVCDAVIALRISLRQLARDMRVLTLATGALAIIEIAFPLSSVYAVGILGAYGIIMAVYLAIAGMSFRFDSTSRTNQERNEIS